MTDFPDYEASRVVAGRLIHEYISFITEMANPGNRYVTGEMVAKGNERILRLMDEVVDVALGDEPLYRLCPHCEGDGFSRDVAYKGPGEPYAIRVDCPTCEQRGFVPVWPKEDADE